MGIDLMSLIYGFVLGMALTAAAYEHKLRKAMEREGEQST